MKEVKNRHLPHLGDKLIFVSDVMKLKKQAWVGVVYRNENNDVYVTYLYIDIAGYDDWEDMTKHPRYNSHDGAYAGLPKSLKKLYSDYGVKEAYEKAKKFTEKKCVLEYVDKKWIDKQSRRIEKSNLKKYGTSLSMGSIAQRLNSRVIVEVRDSDLVINRTLFNEIKESLCSKPIEVKGELSA